MTTDRCPGCAAAVTPGAPWCTLCYADLRAPATAPELVTTVPARPADPVLAPDPILDAPVVKAAPVAGGQLTGWPCLGCGSTVPMSDDACSGCGRPFLPSDTAPTLALPVVGDIGRMDRGQRIVVTIVAALLVTGVFVALAFLAGSIL